MHIPSGVSPEVYASHRDILSVLLLRFMTSRLRAMYQAYDGDLTLCLVLGEIASRNTERFYDERRGIQPHISGQTQQMLPCNALSISDVTGIPRETVRRKLAKLMDLGWIEKTPDDMYVITDKIGQVFAAFDDSQTYDLMHTADQISNILQS
ncbi:MAG: Crp/Fnr family transcriptional regulator [Burkholderiales bacterium]|nr:Crp/Fnr family transcriptional regulator [Burkholderiales bacterium]